MASGTQFVVAWRDGDDKIMSRLYDGWGVAMTDETQVNVLTTDVLSPSAAMDEDGNWALAWESDDSDGRGVWATYERLCLGGPPFGDDDFGDDTMPPPDDDTMPPPGDDTMPPPGDDTMPPPDDDGGGPPDMDFYAIHVDHLGTPIAMTNINGDVVWENRFGPFGEPVESFPNEDPDQDENFVTLNLRFPGQYFDEESGLHYNWNRYYEPETGRYLQADAPEVLAMAKDGRSALVFAYALENPLTSFDVTGQESSGVPCVGRNSLSDEEFEKLPAMIKSFLNAGCKTYKIGCFCTRSCPCVQIDTANGYFGIGWNPQFGVCS
jgi:RHS repeat-associated protein